MDPIIPARRPEPFDDDAWLFDLKLDGFRGVADTIAGRMLSKNGNRLKRYEALLDALPAGYVFDGEIQRPAFRAPASRLRAVRFDGRGRRGRADRTAERASGHARQDRAPVPAVRSPIIGSGVKRRPSTKRPDAPPGQVLQSIANLRRMS